MPVAKGYKQTAEHVRNVQTARLATLRAKPRPVSREWLVREYVERKRGCPEIGRQLGRDPTTILAWLRFYEIPTRRRGAESNPTTVWQKGQVSAFKGKKHTPEAIERIRAASVADGRVPYLRNGTHWLAGKTGAENPRWKGGCTPERQAFYATAEWKAAVVAVWHRADAYCERCGLDHREVRGEQTFHIHHIVSFAVRELRAVVSNLRLLCPSCHRWVHSRENVTGELLEVQP